MCLHPWLGSILHQEGMEIEEREKEEKIKMMEKEVEKQGV